MRDLTDIFTREGLLADRNGDGVADSLRVSFYIQTGVVVDGLIDFCGRLGLETSELDLPCINITDKPGKNRPDTVDEWNCTISTDPAYHEATADCQLDKAQWRLAFTGDSEESINRLLRWMAAHWPHCLESVTASLAENVNRISLSADLIHVYKSDSDTPYYTLSIAEAKISHTVGAESADNAERVGQVERVGEAERAGQPEQSERPRPLKSLGELWTIAGFYQAGRVDLTSKTDVFFTGFSSAKAVEAAARFAARIGLASTGMRFPLTGEAGRIAELTFSLNVTEGEENCVIDWKAHEKDSSAREITLAGDEESIVSALHYLATATPHRIGGTFGAWEDESIAKIRSSKQQEFPVLLEQSWEDSGEKAEIERLFQSELTAIVEQTAAKSEPPRTLSIHAFLSEPLDVREELERNWRREIARLFPDSECVVQINSAFKPGLCWIKENVIPALKARGKQVTRIKISFQREARENGMELPHRWLQEIYPADQVLQSELGLALSHIEFVMDEHLTSTYQVDVWGEEEVFIGTWRLDVPVSSVPYLETKRAHPTTSGLFIQIDGTMVQKSIQTDRERFWQFYSQQFLPALTEILVEEQEVSSRGMYTPLFHSVDVCVGMSEHEERLGNDEENISSLEALHEDIYFYTLDYFAYAGQKRTGKEWNAPGAVRPFVRAEKGSAPYASIRVKAYREEQPLSAQTARLIFDADHYGPIQANILLIDEDGVQPIQHSCPVYTPERFDSATITFPSDSTMAQWSHLAKHPSIHIWEVEESFDKRPIYAVEVTSPRVSAYVSPHKLSLAKPTVLIETGHHPNEVSSMPAIRELVEEIITSRQDWLQRVNLVIIPFANPDGVALHQELTKENPYWKHHAARYNAVGLEYTMHRFLPSIFGEARVVPHLFYRWLPDVIIDDHGIPSHEWTQPFAGYNSPPRFPVSYWIPISLFYGIGRELDRSAFPQHAAALDAIQLATEESIRRDVRIWDKNKRYVDRYIRYGHHWEPEKFPLQDERELIFYRWPTRPDRMSPSLIARHPEWLTLDLITEAADETVYDEALRDCIEAHKYFDRAVVEWVVSHPQAITRTYDDQAIHFNRARPLQFRRIE